jgi:Flp pilus assembly protein TadG
VVAPIVAFMLMFLMAMLAIAFDLGRVALVRAQLQNAADSAALAAASALGTDNLIVSSPSQSADLASARSLAQKFAQANAYDLNGATAVVLNTSTDVTIGTLSTPTVLSQVLGTSGSSASNSVQVTACADASHSGKLPFLFAPVLGDSSTAVQATATATVQLYTVSTVKAVSGSRMPILPITMSKSDYLQMVNKQTGADNYKYNPATNTITSGSDGLQEQQLYPGSNVTSSNNGLIQFGTGSRSNSVLQDQIVNGPTYAQTVAQWPPSGSPTWSPSGTFTIGSDPGWRADSFDDLQTLATSGDVRLIPINDGTSPGNGTGTYTIVALAPVRVVYSDKGGKSSGYALVQPAVLSDPTVVASTTVATSGQAGVPVPTLTR